MVKVLHSSDLHGHLHHLFNQTGFDLWIDTGDLLPNMTRGIGNFEVPYQTKWFQEYLALIEKWLEGRPMLSVPGNHDFIEITETLKEHNIDAHRITPQGIEILGFKFAGFREVPQMIGEWNGETLVFEDLVKDTLDSDPDILVTHAPPAGIRDLNPGGGIPILANALTWSKHRVQAHFFGHIHEAVGVSDVMGIKFINGATCAQIHEI
jgi:Icc-related predicted phosphoesterase